MYVEHFYSNIYLLSLHTVESRGSTKERVRRLYVLYMFKYIAVHTAVCTVEILYMRTTLVVFWYIDDGILQHLTVVREQLH